ncbi:ROK family protein [Alkalispirochaeta americana]|uniref:ROK family protein n=1 Tax=Alkalispirochaeta americana TaxID=159291 RepID=A0A1N6RDM2_9SPIO|nr:ROK family protein [Alkalispirochaeta americana]SIQ26980.1 ROK family protein [Alkalispirochaeta americana]
MGTQDRIKGENLRTLLETLRSSPAVSRADLSRSTGLRPSTVTNLVRELSRQGWVLERGRGTPGAGGGKPSRLLSLDPGRGRYISFFWTSRELTGVLVDCTGRVVSSARRGCAPEVPGSSGAQSPSGEEFSSLLAGLARELQKGSPGGSSSGAGESRAVPILGAALAVASVVTPEGNVRASADFPHDLENLPRLLRQALADSLARGDLARETVQLLPVVVENDANCIAFNAWRKTRLQEEVLLALVFTEDPPSVGAGMVMGGRVWRGARGSAGELLPPSPGHTPEELDMAAATAVRFSDPSRVVISVPDSASPEGLRGELRETRRALDDSGITVETVLHRQAALLGAAHLVYEDSLDTILAGEGMK